LSQSEAAERLQVNGLLGAAFTPHCAAVHPARLVRGLARATESLGATVYEGTPATRLEPGVVHTPHGTLTARVVVRATEAFTAQLPKHGRAMMPLYSYMVATAPLGESFWANTGWQGYETFADGRNAVTYAQRTRDGRIAFGGRGASYHYASRISPSFDTNARVGRRLSRTLEELWPQLRGCEITHHWGGPLGVPRDWQCSVGLDRELGMAWAGGYVGDGVATTNLAGRTLADLIADRRSDLTSLPWVGHRSPRWEPEPLRFGAVNAALQLPALADVIEQRTGRPATRTLGLLSFILHDS
jgi:glycine/D-amino acid oxidase-like deaminating enzyme